MSRKLIGCLPFAMLIAVAAVAQMPQYLDVQIVKVKPEKRAEFDAAVKKVADIQRRNDGSDWIATETIYGENNTVMFASSRADYAGIEKAGETFMGAVNKALGPAGAQKLLNEYNNTILSSRSEVRRRRWDLSYNAPGDLGAFAKMIGQARWVRTMTVRVKPGHEPAFESMVKEVNAAAQKINDPGTVLLSERDSGGPGPTYYITWVMNSLGDADKGTPLPKMLGEEGFQNFLKTVSDSTEGAETTISHFLPELSNPPQQVAAASPDFWRPKTMLAAKSKPKPAAAIRTKPVAAQTQP